MGFRAWAGCSFQFSLTRSDISSRASIRSHPYFQFSLTRSVGVSDGIPKMRMSLSILSHEISRVLARHLYPASEDTFNSLSRDQLTDEFYRLCGIELSILSHEIRKLRGSMPVRSPSLSILSHEISCLYASYRYC